MRLENEFVVDAPAAEVWSVARDPEKVARCLPDLSLEEVPGSGGRYRGTVGVNAGPVSAEYEGSVGLEEAEEESLMVVYGAEGSPAGGGEGVYATFFATLHERGEETLVVLESDLKLPALAEQFGGGIVRSAMDRALDALAECLGREAAAAGKPSGPAEMMDGAMPDTPAPDSPGEGMVEGAIVVGKGPSEAAGSARTREQPQPRLQSISSPESRPESGEAAAAGQDGEVSALRRAAPVLAGLGALAVLIWLLRR